MATTSDYTCKLSQWALEKAINELNEDSDFVEELCDEVVKIVKKDHPEIILDANPLFYLRFLRAKKFNVEKTAQLIANYYRERYHDPEMYQNAIPSLVKHITKQKLAGFLPKRDKNGCKVLIFKPGLWDPYSCSILEVFKQNVMLLETMLTEEDTQVSGIVIIGDFTDYSMTHFWHFSPNAHRMAAVLQNTFPMRFKKLIYVNAPPIIGMVTSLLANLLKSKMLSRIQVVNDQEELHDIVGAECLPEEYGGDEKEDYMMLTSKMLEDNEEMFLKFSKNGISSTGKYTQLDAD